LLIPVLLVGTNFPLSTDPPPSSAELASARDYYAKAYAQPSDEKPDDEAYVRIAQQAATASGIEQKVRIFVNRYNMAERRVLDVGAGRGHLQDLVKDYTALDISPTAARFFHKPFVVGSATAMPFADDEFDAAWSIWVMEHVRGPEQMLREMRRVVKDGGLIYLQPAWDCTPWAAGGYRVRPYRDLNFTGKFIKATIPLQESWFKLGKTPVRFLRGAMAGASGEAATLRYTRLTPNYDKYWEADGDAVNSLDSYETALWFLSRGDSCLNCATGIRSFFAHPEALVIRVRKGPRAQSSKLARTRTLSELMRAADFLL
jgi:SAM-dependent methyltransferase